MIEVTFKFLFCPQVYRFFFPFARTNNFRFPSFSELKLGCFFFFKKYLYAKMAADVLIEKDR